MRPVNNGETVQWLEDQQQAETSFPEQRSASARKTGWRDGPTVKTAGMEKRCSYNCLRSSHT